MNPYIILGVLANADAVDIKAAYRKKAQMLHPDKQGGDTEKFADLQWAYDILKDEEKKGQYDRTGEVEDRQPTTEQFATAEILQAFQGWLQAVINGQISVNSDCISEIRKSFETGSKQILGQKNKVDGQLEKINLMIGKFKFDDSEENVLEGHLGSVRTSLENTVENMNKKIKILNEAVVQLTHFTYTPDGGLVTLRPQTYTTTVSGF